jgi:hypothetical protein
LTALLPFESHAVRAGPSGKYPLNQVCAHPLCTEKAQSKHHCYPKGNLNSHAWFLFLDGDKGSNPIPHVAGFCGDGTRGHHGDVEEHRAWIKYEEGQWVWYDFVPVPGDNPDLWERIGPLNPQPGSREGKPKRKKKEGEARRKRANVGIKVPVDKEDGAGLWDDTQDRIKEKLIREGLYDETDLIPNYEAWMACAQDWLDS